MNVSKVDLQELQQGYGVLPQVSPSVSHFGPATHPLNRKHHPDGRTHSGLAPEFPSLNLHEYTMPPNLRPPRPALPRPSDVELDRLFLSERIQKFGFRGLKAWETLPLTEVLYDGFPGAADDGDQWGSWLKFAETIVQVDESTWFEVLKKPRWFDMRRDPRDELTHPIPPLAQFPEERVHWSVDIKPIWDILRIALELSNRVLKKLIEEENPWFVPTFLFC